MILGDDDSLMPNCIEEFYQNLPEIEGIKCKVVRYATVVNDVVHKKFSDVFTHPKIENATDFYINDYEVKQEVHFQNIFLGLKVIKIWLL